jgi:Carboxypeptidase regulatory-like domain
MDHRKENSGAQHPQKSSLSPILKATMAVLMIVIGWNSALSQSSAGSIDGIVTDPSGAAIVSAPVTLTNLSTGEVRTAATDSVGHYSFPVLPPAIYSVTINATGFVRYLQTGVKLDVATTVAINAKLKVGSSNDSVTIHSDDVPMLETETSTLGYEISQRTIEDLPTDGRNVYGFATLVPGVIAPHAFNQVSTGMYDEQFVVISGSRDNQSLFLLDGGTNSNSAFYGPTLYPSLDSVQEYKVQVNNFSAEYSNSAGGVVNVATKSGTSQLHGSLFEFFRNNDLDANYFFNNRNGVALGAYQYNQFGMSLGGPLTIPHLFTRKDKLFYFVSYEGLQWVAPNIYYRSVPTDMQRNGDFSQTFAPDGTLVTIYDPATAYPNPAVYNQIYRTAFPGNVIPSYRFDPVAAAVMKYYPEPNVAGAQYTNLNNFYVQQSGDTSKNTGSVRLDYSISDKQKIFGRYSENVTVIERPNPNLGAQAPAGATIGDDRLLQYQDVIDYVNAISPKSVIELNTSYNRYPLYRIPPGYNFDPTELGFPSYFGQLQTQANLPPCFPQMDVENMIQLGICGQLNNVMEAYQETGNFMHSFKNHTLKAGGIFGTNQNFTTANVDAAGVYGFQEQQTQGPNALYGFSQYAGNGVASLLLGFAGSGNITSGAPPLFITTKHGGGYVQDDWKPLRNLTLNLGIRYDINTPYTERLNRLSEVDLTSPSPLQVPGLNLVGGFAYPGVNGRSRYVSPVDYKSGLQPRLGFAYAINPTVVIRGGGGIFQGPIIGSGTPQDGYSAQTQMVTSLDSGVTEQNPFSNPYPQGFTWATGSSAGLSTFIGSGGTGIDPGQRTSYAEQWNLDVQTSLPGKTLFDIAYAGTKGVHLYYFYPLNQLPDKYLSMGSALLNQVPNPFYGYISSGFLSYSTLEAEQLLLPYPQFGYINTNSSEGSSIYHAMQVVFRRNFHQGLSFMLSYTWSKQIDDMDGLQAYTGVVDGGNIQDWDNPKAERAVAIWDVAHNINVNWVYELPVGKNKPFLHHGVGSAILGGWQFNGIANFRTGVPLQISTLNNTLYNNGGSQRPNSVPGVSPYVTGSMYTRINNYFNSNAFVNPAPFTYGDIARNLSYLRGPGQANWDLSIFRKFSVTDRIMTEFRAEAFNAFNRTEFGLPDTTLGDGTTGQITSQANNPRTLQLALKIIF